MGDSPLAETSRLMTERAEEVARLGSTRGGGGRRGDKGTAARWSTALSSKVNLLRAMNFRAFGSANLVNQDPRIRPQRNRRTTPCGVTGGTSTREKWMRTSRLSMKYSLSLSLSLAVLLAGVADLARSGQAVLLEILSLYVVQVLTQSNIGQHLALGPVGCVR